MIITLNQYEISAYPGLFDQMYRLRATVFHERLGWDVVVEEGWERDRFDNEDPLYVMSVSDDLTVLHGACRLLPTSGPHMMSDVFGAHFEPDATLRTPLIWEITRFCTADGTRHPTTPSGLHHPTIEMLAGVCELGMRYGISHVTAVFEPLMGRIYRRAGLRTSIIGRSDTLGPRPVLAGIWDLDERTLAALRKSGGFQDSVVVSPASVRTGYAA